LTLLGAFPPPSAHVVRHRLNINDGTSLAAMQNLTPLANQPGGGAAHPGREDLKRAPVQC
jgi:hypothetical protein